MKPGRGTLQRAIDDARPGDELELRRGGAYRGGVVIDKRLTISGPRERRRPIVDGRCREAFTILVLDGNVTLDRLRVTGATDEAATQYGGAEVNFIDGPRGAVSDLKVSESCSGTQYGVNVFDTGDVSVTDSEIAGYLDAAIYVGGIRNPRTTVEARGNVARGNNHGILIEDSLARPEIVVADNATRGNDEGPSSAGVYIRNSDGVLIEGNSSTASGFAGLWLDSNSDSNVVRGNAAAASGTADLLNDGSANCGSANSFPVQAGSPLAPC